MLLHLFTFGFWVGISINWFNSLANCFYFSKSRRKISLDSREYKLTKVERESEIRFIKKKLKKKKSENNQNMRERVVNKTWPFRVRRCISVKYRPCSCTLRSGLIYSFLEHHWYFRVFIHYLILSFRLFFFILFYHILKKNSTTYSSNK